MAMRRRTWIWLIAGAVLVVLAAVTLIWFQPQKLFYDNTVDEALPTVSAPADSTDSGTDGGASDEPVELATGTFISREHDTMGTARILRLADGSTILRLEGFETSNGPALYVYLSQNTAQGDDGAFDDDYIDLGALKGNIGDQNYVIPPEIDPLGFTSVVVWCDRFNVSFGAADLEPAGV